MKRFLKFRYGQGGFTLIELLIVIAILGILAAVIIPNVGSIFGTATVNAANTEAENVKVAAIAYCADHGTWTGVNTGDDDGKTYRDYLSGTAKADYHFSTTALTAGCIDGVGDPGQGNAQGNATKGGSTSSGWSDIEWKGDPCEGHWVKGPTT